MASPRNDSLDAVLVHALEALKGRTSLYDMAAAVTDTVRCAVAMVPAADSGAVSVASGRNSASHGSTSEAAADLDAVQHGLHEGPCLSALDGPPLGTRSVVADDLAGADAQRWPRFAAASVELGFPTVLSVQLRAPVGTGAALNLYGRVPGTFEPADVVVALAFVEHLAHLLFGEARDTGRSMTHAGQPAPGAENLLRQLLDPPAIEA